MSPVKLSRDTTVHGAMATVAEALPDLEAIVFQDERITFGELNRRIDALAAGLCRLGVAKGDVVVVVLPTCPEFVYAHFAIGKVGAVLSPVIPLYRRQELAYILSDCDAAAVILQPDVMGNKLLEIVQELRPDLPHLKHVIVRGDEAPDGTVSLDSLMEMQEPQPPADLAGPDDLFGLLYTSGTTGGPKAVMHSHRTIMAQVVNVLEYEQSQRERAPLEMIKGLIKMTMKYGTRYLKYGSKQNSYMPLMPIYTSGGHIAMRATLLSGKKMVLIERFHPVRALELIGEEEVNTVTATPSMWRLMLQVKDFEKYNLSSLLNVSSGMAYIPPKIAEEVQRRFNAPLIISYGATETAGGVTMTQVGDDGKAATQSIGRVAYDNTKVRVVDDDHREVAVGQVGELAMNQPGTMLGYYKSPELTAQVLDADGWYYSGDLGFVDERGVVTIVGRKKDMIIRGGQNIYPAEVESFILTHPKIAEVAIVGVPSEVEGETVWAFVVPEEGQTVTPSEVLRHCRGEITAFKVPSEVRIVDELPRNALTKVKKFELRERAIEELEAAAG